MANPSISPFEKPELRHGEYDRMDPFLALYVHWLVSRGISGVEVQYWPDEMPQGFSEAAHEVVKENSAKDADCKRVH